MPSNRPIFIIGVHRSGTTLLRFMLSSHPRIYIPPESDFIPRFFLGNPTGNLSEKQVAEMLDIIFGRYRFAKEWQGAPPDPQEIWRSMSPKKPAAFLDSLYSLYAQQYSAQRWGDKTPIYSSYVPLLNQLFPAAQFIHLIRDGRDAALSMLDKWGNKEYHIDIYFAARNWVRRIGEAQEAGHRIGNEHFHELRYEQLVADPDQELRKICGFLGEQFYPDMSRPQLLGQKQIIAGSFHDPVRQAPGTQRIERWRAEMAPEDLRLFHRIAGSELERLGYAMTDPGTMSAKEQARFAALKMKYTTLQTGRRGLQTLGVMPPI
ncbi:MAG: sulfotransferase [Chloroflexota bacterium]|nr:sulfotransferase [Chloroflexota bacterium]